LPKRLLDKALQHGLSKGYKIEFEPLLDEYYKIRGWDQDGVPSLEKLSELGLLEEGKFL